MSAALSCLAAGGAAFAAGLVNAVAGGGTLISFPTLVALGVPAIASNITNTVALCPGYFGGTFAQRDELRAQRQGLPWLLAAAAAGGLTGSILLVCTSEGLFRGVVPFLILLASALLGLQGVIKQRLGGREAPPERPSATGRGHSVALGLAVFAGAVYGGYFGAGLGIMLLAVLGLTGRGSLAQQNAVKQALSLTVNVVAALFFAFSRKVYWQLAAVMAGASLLGGNLGGHLASRLNPTILRAVVVLLGVAVAVKFWL